MAVESELFYINSITHSANGLAHSVIMYMDQPLWAALVKLKFYCQF